MLVDFNEIKEITIPGINHGTGEIFAKMYMNDHEKIIPYMIHPGGSIGMHAHPTSDDINSIISGSGETISDGKDEVLKPGVCHICKNGSHHSIINTGMKT